ncbi:hypothetical protein ASPWEDRAFT_72613 [Aspergillus wentii DTO 134E9]|uniref:Uncharacterized protein n=1 Tax=Aspergillus wentii DTO 134E9 TaxID=1073089 RepID=A0A1L9R5D8_ASPWE|nr:uncharacterized protein ASPWEDRAFT_72613 [Aspergillus wentii DTO 134E9]OJJ30136.1 hypothetical protein ASPWEDRAFT_72613 [Aspergillus wentii DTO 134E9]
MDSDGAVAGTELVIETEKKRLTVLYLCSSPHPHEQDEQSAISDDEDNDLDSHSEGTTSPRELSYSKHPDHLKNKFLDRLAEIFARQKSIRSSKALKSNDAHHVTASALSY